MENKISQDEKLFTEDTEYKRDLGLPEAVSIGIGKIIGSGIFATPQPIMALVGCTSLFGLVWLLGGIVTIFGAVCYAELVAMMPQSGGPYVYLKAAFHPVFAFLRGWAMFFVSETAAISAVAFVFADYTAAMIRITSDLVIPQAGIVAIAISSVWGLTLVNLFGVHLSGMIQNIFSSAKVLAIGAIIGICFTSGGNAANFTAPLWPESFSWGTVLAVGAALRYSFFAFSGWEGATLVAEEVKNPRRNLPLALLLTILGVLFLYLGANAAYLYQIPVSLMKTSSQVAADAMRAAIGGAGGAMISAAVMMNTFGNVSAQILTKARSWQAMARDGLFFAPLARIHPEYRTPNTALLAQATWASMLLLLASLSGNIYKAIIDFFAATGAVFNIMVLLSLYILRKKFPDAPRPYRAWLYPWSLIIVIVFYATYLVVTVITAFLPSVYGLALTSTGLIYYFWKMHGKIPKE